MAFDANNLPSYKQLPVKPGAPEGSAWGLFGDDDQLGCLNLLTPERVAAAAKLVRTGRVFPLNLSIDQPSPPLFGRGAPVVHLLEFEVARDEYIDSFYPQASSQWDGLRHIRHPRDGFYNGTKDEDIRPGEGRLGMENFARRGIAGRGVLLDVARYLQKAGRPLDPTSSTMITPDNLRDCAKAQGTQLQTGDILLVRTGWLQWYLNEATAEQKQKMTGADAALRELRAPGLAGGAVSAEYLWDLHIAAVAADNPALEAWPPGPETGGFLHFELIPRLGIPIGELWYLDGLADDCAEDGVYEFLFTSAPLNVPGGVGSPPNAIAIK